ncbi:DUF861 domain-containing protein [Chelatococcus asaccharovorans]|nr:DUF861 domain-containing protein [Chelatococcus asaccharovorans]
MLEGAIEIAEDGKEPLASRAGDSFVMKPGFAGTWRTVKTVRKIDVIVG